MLGDGRAMARPWRSPCGLRSRSGQSLRAADGHHAVADDLGDDRSGGDRLRALVALDQRAARRRQGRAARRGHRRGRAWPRAAGRTAHGASLRGSPCGCRCASMLAAQTGGDGDAERRARGSRRTARRAARRSAAWNRRGRRECWPDRARRPPPRPVRRAGRARPRPVPATGQQAFGYRLRLEGEVGSFDDFEEERRIGARGEPWCGDARIGSDSPQVLPGRLGRRCGKAPSTGRGARPDGISGGSDCLPQNDCHSSISCSLLLGGGIEQVGPERRALGVQAEPLGGDLEAPADLPGIGAGAASCACPIPHRSPCRRASSGSATSHGGSGRDSGAAASP